ncbi:hypothetical protein [Sphingomonas sp. MS122]
MSAYAVAVAIVTVFSMIVVAPIHRARERRKPDGGVLGPRPRLLGWWRR